MSALWETNRLITTTTVPDEYKLAVFRPDFPAGRNGVFPDQPISVQVAVDIGTDPSDAPLTLVVSRFSEEPEVTHALSQLGLKPVQRRICDLRSLYYAYRCTQCLFRGNIMLGNSCGLNASLLGNLTTVRFVSVPFIHHLNLVSTSIEEFFASDCEHLSGLVVGHSCKTVGVMSCNRLYYIADPWDNRSRTFSVLACGQLRTIVSPTAALNIAFCPLLWSVPLSLRGNLVGPGCWNLPPPLSILEDAYMFDDVIFERRDSTRSFGEWAFRFSAAFNFPVSPAELGLPDFARNLDQAACRFEIWDRSLIVFGTSLQWETYVNTLNARTSSLVSLIPPKENLYKFVTMYEGFDEETSSTSYGIQNLDEEIYALPSRPPSPSPPQTRRNSPVSPSNAETTLPPSAQASSNVEETLAIADLSLGDSLSPSQMYTPSPPSPPHMELVPFQFPVGFVLYVEKNGGSDNHFVIRELGCTDIHEFCEYTINHGVQSFHATFQAAIRELQQAADDCNSIKFIHFLGNLPLDSIHRMLRSGIKTLCATLTIAFNFFPVCITHDFELVCTLFIYQCRKLRYVRPGVFCQQLIVQSCENLTTINMPNKMRTTTDYSQRETASAEYNLIAVDCPVLTVIDCGGSMYLQDCPALERLPRELTLDAFIGVGPGCTRLPMPSGAAIRDRLLLVPELSGPNAQELIESADIPNNPYVTFFEGIFGMIGHIDSDPLRYLAPTARRPNEDFTLCPFQRICCFVGTRTSPRLQRALSRIAPETADVAATAIIATGRRARTSLPALSYLPTEIWKIISSFADTMPADSPAPTPDIPYWKMEGYQ